MTIQIRANVNTGAHIDNVSLDSITQSTANQLRQALGEHGVLFFHNQSLTPDTHIGLAEKFGSININRFFSPLPGYPQIAQVLKEPDQKKNIGEQWHTDHSYDQIPALGSILVAKELPDAGGDTLFSSMFKAYDGLPTELKERVKSLTATHSSRHRFGARVMADNEELVGRLGNAEMATQDAVHPVVVKHPISGKSAIYVNPDFTLHINDVSADESETLLQTLYTHCQRDEYVYRFKWTPGSVAFWDNRATWHRALNDYSGQRRFMHRITIEGESLHAATNQVQSGMTDAPSG